jgi:hypothetical protein
MPKLKQYNDYVTMSEYAKTITDKKLLKTAKKAADEFIKENIENQDWYRAESPKRGKSRG